MVHIQIRPNPIPKSELHRYIIPERMWQSALYPRLYKKHKGNLITMITYLYNNRNNYDTYAHRIYWEFFVQRPERPECDIKKLFVPLSELLQNGAGANIEIVYNEMLKHKALLREDFKTVLRSLPSRNPLLIFLLRINTFTCHLNMRDEMFLKAKEGLVLFINNSTTENHIMMCERIGYLKRKEILKLIKEIPQDHLDVLLDAARMYFHVHEHEKKMRTSLSWSRFIVWEYDLEVIWDQALLNVGDVGETGDTVLDRGGVLLEYYLLKNPERMQIFENILNGTKARPSEMVQFFKTGTLPSSGNLPSEEEVLLF